MLAGSRGFAIVVSLALVAACDGSASLNHAMADQAVKPETEPLEIRDWQEYAPRTRDTSPSGHVVGSVSK